MALEDAQHRYEDLKRQMAETNAALSEMRFTGLSDDEYVTATVTATGHLASVEFNPRVFRKPDSDGLAEAVMTATARAREQATAKSTELLQSVLGPVVTPEGLTTETGLESLVQAAGRRIRGEAEGDR